MSKAKALKKILDTGPTVQEVAEKHSVDPSKVSIWERRLINPGPEGGVPILLTEEGWTLRWINTKLANRFYRAVHQQGWTQVKLTELKDPPETLGLTDNGDGLVRRGDRGEEILMKIPTPVFTRIQRRKAEVERENMKKTRQRLAEAAAAEHGAEAGEFVTSRLKGQVLDSMERHVVDSDLE